MKFSYTYHDKIFAFLLVFILPPLFNHYEDIFSVGELIASGYACFTNDQDCLYDFIDVASLFYPQQCN